VPGPSFSSFADIHARAPSTAETCTGTSNSSASRSAIEVGQGFLDRLFAAFGAAAAPFDAAVAARHMRVFGDHHAALIAFFMGDLVQPGLERERHDRRGAQGDARLADGLVHGLAQGNFHVTGGQGGQRGGGYFLGHGERDSGGFAAQQLDLGLAVVEGGANLLRQVFDGGGDACGGAIFAFVAGQGLERFEFFGGQGLLLARLGGGSLAVFLAVEFRVEGEFLGGVC
jgi:hypothetical protein